MFVYLYLCVCTNHTREDVLRSQWQRACYRLLRPSEAHIALIHLRRRLDRWNLTLLPGRRVSRAVLLLRGLGAAAPPRVGAAVLRTFCNDWITGRLMQRASSCILGCSVGGDSIEHYAYCKGFAAFRVARLQLEVGPPHARLDTFLGLNVPFSNETERLLTKQACAL